VSATTASAGLLTRIESQAQSENYSTPIHGLRHGRHRSPSSRMDTSTGFEISNKPCGRSGPSSGPHRGSKSVLLRTLVAASSAGRFGVPSSVPKRRARMLRWPASRTRTTRQARPHCSSRRCPSCCALRTQVGHRAKVRKVPKLGNERCCYTGSTGGPSTLLARLLNFDSRALPENSVRRAGSNSPPRSGPRSELRRGPGPNSVHSFFGNFESSPPVGGQTRKVDLGRALRRFQPR
jgi:hypothetical protein